MSTCIFAYYKCQKIHNLNSTFNNIINKSDSLAEFLSLITTALIIALLNKY